MNMISIMLIACFTHAVRYRCSRLLHDDVNDDSDSRRGLKALNTLLGNKVAILAGDFLLARASVVMPCT